MVLCLTTKRIFYFILHVIIDAEWHFLKAALSEIHDCFGDCYHVIAVDRVLLNCFCTKMEFKLQMSAVTTHEPLYACIKGMGQTFWLGYDGFTVWGPNNQRKVIKIVFLPCWPLNWSLLFTLFADPTTHTFMSFLLCNMLNMTLQTQNPVFKVKFYSIHILCVYIY